MVRIAITGAAGRVGREAVAALDDHDTRLLTHRQHDDLDSTVLEITDRDAVREALDGIDVLVHLAANPSPFAEWDELKGPNVDGVYNVYEAAVENDLDRVVFASSNHAVHMHNVGDPADPETIASADAVRPIAPDDPSLPDSYYGITKVLGEAFGNYYAHRHPLEVISLRIGWLLPPEELRETQDDPEVDSRFARAMWLSPPDCRRAIRAAATESLPESPATVNVVSRNDDRYLSLTHTQRVLGYRPRDNATETLDAVEGAR